MLGVFDCEVVVQSRVTDGVFQIILNCSTIADEAQPGQFVNVTVADGADPLLRRPLSIHAVYPEIGAFSLIYAVRGKGTKMLAEKHRGDVVNVVGPLGKPFGLGDDPEARHILVCGGCGTPPIAFLCQALCEKWDSDKVVALLGAGSNDAVLCRTDFAGFGAEVGIATEDGSCGHHGFVTQLLSKHLASPANGTRVYACGPWEMLKEVARISKEAGASSCQVSLEKHMACGLGLCLGCVQKCKTADGRSRNRRVCTDGPVFEAEDVIWEQ